MGGKVNITGAGRYSVSGAADGAPVVRWDDGDYTSKSEAGGNSGRGDSVTINLLPAENERNLVRLLKKTGALAGPNQPIHSGTR